MKNENVADWFDQGDIPGMATPQLYRVGYKYQSHRGATRVATRGFPTRAIVALSKKTELRHTCRLTFGGGVLATGDPLATHQLETRATHLYQPVNKDGSHFWSDISLAVEVIPLEGILGLERGKMNRHSVSHTQ